MSRCPSCLQDEASPALLLCRDEDGEQMVVVVCKNCDHGINDHTEGECQCVA
jgi:DNA-directed RNA polymerase subunit M/transcription elongation factor TFIIS